MDDDVNWGPYYRHPAQVTEVRPRLMMAWPIGGL